MESCYVGLSSASREPRLVRGFWHPSLTPQCGPLIMGSVSLPWLCVLTSCERWGHRAGGWSGLPAQSPAMWKAACAAEPHDPGHRGDPPSSLEGTQVQARTGRITLHVQRGMAKRKPLSPEGVLPARKRHCMLHRAPNPFHKQKQQLVRDANKNSGSPDPEWVLLGINSG